MKVKDLLNSPDKWIKGCYARNKEGLNVYLTDQDAVCFCLAGAIFKCYDSVDEQRRILSKINKIIGIGVYSWNDAPQRTFQDVRELVEKLDI